MSGADRPITILLVEDSPADARLVVELLRNAQVTFAMEHADRLAPALERLRGSGVDVVLLDLGLPDSQGLETFQRMRRFAADQAIVVLSGLADEQVALEALQAGAQDYLVKGRIQAPVLGRVIRYAIERKRAERERLEEQARFRALVENSLDAVVVFGEDGSVQYASPTTRRVLEYEPAELIGRNAFDFVHPDHHALLAGRMAESLARPRQPVPAEALIRNRSGAWRRLEGTLTNLLDEPAVRGIAGNYRDITERRESEELIRRLSLAVEQSPVGVLMTDVAGTIEYVNSRFTEITGYSPAEAIGQTPRILKSGSTPDAVYVELWSAITGGRPWQGEMLNRRKDGSLYWDAMWVYPIHDAEGAVSRFLAFKEDITERRAADAELRDTAARLRTLMEHASDGIAVLTSQGIILQANRRIGELVGRPVTELGGRHISEFVSPGIGARLGEFTADTASGSVPGVEFPHPDGTVSILDFSLSAVELASERLLLLIGRDVTEQRSVEQQLLHSQKMEAIGQLAGGVAHDFNNILTAIFGYADQLGETLPPGTREHEVLFEMRQAAERAASLTRQLLAFSRRQVLQAVVLNPNEQLRDLEKLLRRIIGEDIALSLSLAADLGNVRADAGQLDQVLINLAVNSRDSMPRGGKLVIETANCDIGERDATQHHPVAPGRYVVLTVSDNGSGMDEHTRARIFEPFFTTKEKGRGTGLGLSTVYGIVKQSRGYIWVYSEPGRGATFRIYLPRVDAPAAATPRAPQSTTMTGAETILLAEARALDGPIHLLVTDVVMPEGSGQQLARRLAQTRPETRVLYCSGYTDEAIVRHGILEPGINFLEKPFTADTLARKVREVLDAT